MTVAELIRELTAHDRANVVRRPGFAFAAAICRTKGCGYVVTETVRAAIHENVKCSRCGECYVQMFKKVPAHD